MSEQSKLKEAISRAEKTLIEDISSLQGNLRENMKTVIPHLSPSNVIAKHPGLALAVAVSSGMLVGHTVSKKNQNKSTASLTLKIAETLTPLALAAVASLAGSWAKKRFPESASQLQDVESSAVNRLLSLSKTI